MLVGMADDVLFDESQRAVLGVEPLCTASVIGAPGTGKTRLVRELAVKLVKENPAVRVAVLSPDRRAASDLRNKISFDLGYLPGALSVQSLTAFAFGIVSAYSQFVGRREPELISGSRQDALIKEILEIGLELGHGGHDEELVKIPAYRAEFRDLITRAAELAMSPADLAAVGERYGEPVWGQGAAMIADYENALATQAAVGHGNPDIVDHARVLTQAAGMLRSWDLATPGGSGRLGMSKPRWDWIIVDDIQNATLAVRTLLRSLHEDGASILTFGDPDTAVQGFRGGIAHLPALLTKPIHAGGLGAQRYTLSTRYRGGGEMGELIRKITSGIHTAGAGKHRKAAFRADAEGGCGASARVEAMTFANEDEEIAFVAAKFRELHYVEGVPYSDMAVVTRSTAAHGAIRRTLLHYGVPVESTVNNQPLREQRAVAALISLIDVALADPADVTAESLEALLGGVLFAIEPLELRKLRRQMRGWELARGGTRSQGELLRDILEGGEVASKIPEFAKVFSVIESIRQASAEGRLGEEVLWAAWDGTGVAESWRAQALAGGLAGDGTNEDLDAVISLFRIAQRQADRDVTNATIWALLDVLESQDIPEDSIARVGGGHDEVALASPSATIGRSWDYVAIVGVNEGSWPNTQLRNPLTKVPKLVNIVVGSTMAGREVEPTQLVSDVIDDELRMLLQAVSRANTEVILTAQQQDGIRPSRFLQWLFPELAAAPAVASTLETTGLVGQLRQALRSGDAGLVEEAGVLLGQLAAAGITEADERYWAEAMALTTHEPVVDGAARMSPSRVESLLTCPLRAFLDNCQARSEDSTFALDIGKLIHTLAEHHPHGPQEAILAEYKSLASQLEFSEGLSGYVQRRRLDQMVSHLAKYLTAESQHVRVETAAEGTVFSDEANAEITVRARIDRLEQVKNAARIVDFKTGRNAISKDEAKINPQMRVYQWLVDQGGVAGIDRSLGARLVYLGTKSRSASLRDQEPLSAEEAMETEQMVKRADSAQRGPNFAAVAGSYCRGCAYRSSCPAQGTGRIFS